MGPLSDAHRTKPRLSRRRRTATLRSLVAIGAVALAGSACASGSPPPAAAPPTTVVLPTLPATSAVPPVPAPPAPGPVASAPALDVVGESAPGAVIEVAFADGRDPLRTQTDPGGAYHLTVDALRAGTNSLSVTARLGRQAGAATNLTARFLLQRGASTTTSALTCARPMTVVVDLNDNAAALRVSC
jgi:hypothetical protein